MKNITPGLFGGPWGLGALGPTGPLDKTALPKTEMFTDILTKMWNINATQRIPCAIFTKFAEFVPRFRMR